MNAEQSMLELILSFVSVGIMGILWLAVLIGSLVKWTHVRPMFKAGIILGLVTLVLKLPGTLASMYYMNIDSLLGGASVGAWPS